MSFFREHRVNAVRKRHHCDVCPARIEIGEPAIRWSGMTDGDFGHAIYHVECRAAEIEYNRIAQSNWDEWYPLSEHEDDDRAWLIADFPAVATRFGYIPSDAANSPAASPPPHLSTRPASQAVVADGLGENSDAA